MTLHEYLKDRYSSSPEVMNAFVNKSCRLLSVHQARWRGQATVDEAEVTVKGNDIKGVVSEPRWNLLPDEMKKKWAALERSVKDVLSVYAEGGELPDETKDQDQAEMIAALCRGGTYLVDSANIATVKKLIGVIQKEWREAADAYTTEDGYQKFRDMISEKVGEKNFGLVQKLIPERNKLGNKFRLLCYELPVVFSTNSSKSTPERESFILSAIEALIKNPRVRLAQSLETLMNGLGERDNGKFVAKTNRRIKGVDLEACVENVKSFKSACKYSDDTLNVDLYQLTQFIPDDAGARTALAKKINANDAMAETLYVLIETASIRATDDAAMIESAKANL